MADPAVPNKAATFIAAWRAGPPASELIGFEVSESSEGRVVVVLDAGTRPSLLSETSNPISSLAGGRACKAAWNVAALFGTAGSAISSSPNYWRLDAANHSSRTSRSEEHTSELQSPCNLVCRLLLEKIQT